MATRRLNNNYAKLKKSIYIRIQDGRLADRPQAGRPLPLLLLGPNHRPASGLPRRSLRHANIWKPNCKTERGGSGLPLRCPAAPRCLHTPPRPAPGRVTHATRSAPAAKERDDSHACSCEAHLTPVLYTHFTKHYNHLLPES